MPSDKEIYEAVIETCKKHVPKLRIIAKKKSWMHRAIGKILKYFGNPNYMDNYFTTIGYTVAHPGEMDYGDWSAYPHESGHSKQAKHWTRMLFGMLYLLGTPVYLIPALLFSWPFFVWLPWWSGLTVIGFFLLLCSPVPFGMWRAHWEFQMYGLSIAIRYWRGYAVDDEYLTYRAKEFTTGAYFWMYPYGGAAKRRLKKALKEAISGSIFKQSHYGPYYADVYKTMKKLGVITKPALAEPAE